MMLVVLAPCNSGANKGGATNNTTQATIISVPCSVLASLGEISMMTVHRTPKPQSTEKMSVAAC